ncbi:unnamed protein product [Brachionus calyciflorus]|uniref:Transient receptor ion channel domain-containing protein n=1 Tax=Brachionus calyciflorus TaxID=104777 RepID=A0A814GA12_9BILA|nr:unnamed protein product [Brachionus calyciflorus]
MSNSVDLNDVFREACKNGDSETVKEILESIKNFNIEITDNFGRSALKLAIQNDNLEVIKLLLPKSKSKRIREALLLSIYLSHTEIVECILRHSNYKIFNDKKLVNGATDSFWQTPSSDDAQFSPDITPIMLAAQYNRIEIVQMLLLNGDRIEKPHYYYCKCIECSNKFEFDSLRHAQSRLNAYKGLASESYISLASLDPILTAFELGKELKFLSQEEKYFKNEYTQLADNLSIYTCKLLSNVRGRDELEIVLNKTGMECEEKYSLLARLDLAIEYQEMPFVAHPNCQQKLIETWFTGIRNITKMNQIIRLVFFICIILSMPILSLSYIIVPQTRLGKLIRQPCIKFILCVTSYVFLVIFMILSSIELDFDEINQRQFSTNYPIFYNNFTSYVTNKNLTYRFDVNDFYIRSTKPSLVDLLISIWILGLIVNELKQIYFYSLKAYFITWYSIIDAFSYSLFICSFVLKYYTIFRVLNEIKKLDCENFWLKVRKLDSSDHEGQIEVFKTFYWLNNDRFYWFTWDPIHLSESLFALSTTLSFCKLLFFLPANQSLGPLQIAIGRMIKVIFLF